MSYDLAAFGRFTRTLTLQQGPMVLEPFQREILRDHFGPARELVVVIPKKNYKTTTLAALGLFHLREVEQAEVPIVASSREQAGVMFRQAEMLIRNSGTKDPDRKDRYLLGGVAYEIRSGYREIRCNGGRLKVLAADADTADGVIPTLALVDELHRAKSGELYGLLADSLGPRDARMVTISTAGATERSPLGDLRARAHELPRTMKGRHLRVQDGAFVLHEWALDPDTDNPENFRTVKMANPAKTQSITELKRRRTSPTMTHGRWLRFACGIWTEGEEPVISGAAWDALKVDIGRVEPGEDVWLSVITGANATIAVVAPRPGGKVAVTAFIYEDLSGALTEAELIKLREVYRIREVTHPRAPFLRSAEILTNAGLPMVETPYSVERYVAISATFNRLLLERLLMHDGNPDLRAAALAVTTKEAAKGWHYLQTQRTAPMIAVANACHQATQIPDEAPIFGVL